MYKYRIRLCACFACEVYVWFLQFLLFDVCPLCKLCCQFGTLVGSEWATMYDVYSALWL